MKSPTEMINYLTLNLDISRSMLAGLLDINPRSLNNMEYFAKNSNNRYNSLLCLSSFVEHCIDLKVPKGAIINLLVEPIDLLEFGGNSPIFYVIEDSSSTLFNQNKIKIINSFLDSIEFQHLFNT